MRLAAIRRRSVVRALVTLLGCGMIGAAPAPPQAHPISLDDAIAGALAKNDDILIGRAARDASEAALTGARGAYDPLLELGADWRQVTTPVNSAFSGAPEGTSAPTDELAETTGSLAQLLPTGGRVAVRSAAGRATTNGAFGLLSPAYTSQLGVELRQPLLRDRGIDSARSGLRIAAADRDRAVASLTREVSETVAAVETSYWRLVAARREVTVREDAVGLAARQLTETQGRIDSGELPETEIAQPRAELERRRGDLLESREAAARAENALKRLVLGDDDDLWAQHLVPTAETEVEIKPADVAGAMDEALASRPELDAAQALVERRRTEAVFARDRALPALDLVVSYDRFGLAGSRNPAAESIPGLPTDVPAGLEGDLGTSLHQLVDGPFDDARVGVVVGLPIRNRAARAAAEIAASGERQAEAELARARKAIRAEVLDAAAALETASARIDAARAAREAAEVQLSSEEERFAAGLSTNFLVLTRQNDLADARLAEIGALTDYRAARTELARAKGSLLAERGIEIEGR